MCCQKARTMGYAMTRPFVSFLCPTFGRPPLRTDLLADCIAAYLAQDYPAESRELLILNDAASQTLIVNAPGVRVVNLPMRVPTLGDKRNLLIDLARGDILLPCDDDDISLPWRASQAVEKLAGFDYWTPRAHWYHHPKVTQRQLVLTWNVDHNSAAFRAGCLRYRSTTGNEDLYADIWAHQYLHVNPETLTDKPEQVSYIYRFGVSGSHISSAANMQQNYDQRTASPGTFVIEPRESRPWLTLVRKALNDPEACRVKRKPPARIRPFHRPE